MGTHRRAGSRSSQHGAALLILVLIVLLATTYAVINRLSAQSLGGDRQISTSAALAQARDALIGFAVTYRDSHASEVFGFLPCPDADNNGQADLSCGVGSVSAAGRLPWQTLGLPALRDGDGECLWYAVSGTAKDTPKIAAFNWDTAGQFIVQDALGTTTLVGASPHERPFAVVLAARGVIGSQTRAPAGTTECGGSNTSTDYLEGLGALSAGNTIVRLSTADSVRNGSNNDQGLWISSKDIFDRVKKRGDFKNDIDALINDLANYLNNLAPASLPTASSGNKGIDTVITGYLAANPSLPPQKAKVLSNWRDNLLYAGGPAGSFTVNSSATICRALLFFSGERTNAQTRITAAEKGDSVIFGDATKYLEGANALQFPGNGAYTGATQFSAISASADITRCINGLGSGAASFAIPSDFASFVPIGTAVTTNTTTPSTPTVSIADASGTRDGCFWFPNLIPLAGKTLRAYYEFQFMYPDTYAISGGLGGPASDRGNGFTLQMVRSDFGAPVTCGKESNLGALTLGDLPGGLWGSLSFIVETDVLKNTSRADPAENHTAIMTNGDLSHSLPGTMSTACNGTASGCRHSPPNKFEESPSPLPHNQRIEIHTGCTPGCGSCNPASHVAPDTYARISVWVDCANCGDVVADLDRTANPPTVQRCSNVPTEMNSIYFGFTGGFLSEASAGEAPAQGVTIKNFSLRSD